MLLSYAQTKVYLALGNTDMRKAINGLSILVQESMELDPFSGHLFVFCNRKRNILKILYWDRNGFCLWTKRLEKHFFRWPESNKDVIKIEQRELMWLVDGLEINQRKAHKRLSYSVLF
jgi:transposase